MSGAIQFVSDFLYYMVSGTIYISAGVVLGFFIVSKFAYTPVLFIEEEEEEKDEKEIPFEEQLKDELENITDFRTEIPKEELKELMHKQLTIKSSPNGEMVMFYDSENEAFHYYCDTKSTTYKILERVARQYVIAYDCKCLYVNMDGELERLKTEADERSKMEKEEEEEKDKKDKKETGSIWAVFKNYKTDNKKNKLPEIKEKINRFKYLGKLNEMKNKRSTSSPEDYVNIDYAAFKKKH